MVGKGVIGRCIETGDIFGVDLEELWRPLRSCSRAVWEAQDEIEVRQRLDFEEFKKVEGAGNIIPGGHLNYVLAVPILAATGGRVLGCVAMDIPPSQVPPGVSEGHYIVEGLRGIADALGQS